MNYPKIRLDATNAHKEFLQAQKAYDEAMTKLNSVVRPYCEEAINEFNRAGGVQITLREQGIIYKAEDLIDLDIAIHGKDGREFDEDLYFFNELERVYGSRLRPILEKKFRANKLPLTLGELSVPSSYYAK